MVQAHLVLQRQRKLNSYGITKPNPYLFLWEAEPQRQGRQKHSDLSPEWKSKKIQQHTKWRHSLSSRGPTLRMYLKTSILAASCASSRTHWYFSVRLLRDWWSWKYVENLLQTRLWPPCVITFNTLPVCHRFFASINNKMCYFAS